MTYFNVKLKYVYVKLLNETDRQHSMNFTLLGNCPKNDNTIPSFISRKTDKHWNHSETLRHISEIRRKPKCYKANITKSTSYHSDDQTDCGIYELPQPDWGLYASSSSTSTPSQSLGWRNITGFPWAPILGSADRVLMFFAFRSAIAAVMSSTCNQEGNNMLRLLRLTLVRPVLHHTDNL